MWNWDVDEYPAMDGETADKGFVVRLDGEPVLFMLSPHPTRITGGSTFTRNVTIDGVDHEISLSVAGVDL